MQHRVEGVAGGLRIRDVQLRVQGLGIFGVQVLWFRSSGLTDWGAQAVPGFMFRD